MTEGEATKRIVDHMAVHKIGEYPHLKLAEALNMALAALRAQAEAEANEPLTQEQISGMHFEKIWLDYGKDNGGEWAVVLFGKIYSIDTLEGAGFEEMVFDLADGETLDHPSGQYTAYRHKPKEVSADVL